MIKKIGIVSLSSGVMGEDFIKHELDIGLKRLKELNIEVVFLSNALKGMKYLKENPKARALDLIEAFKDDSIDMILCAIGGNDTYRLAPYLFENDELKKVIKKKVFLGFSDTTVNHFMLSKLGLNTFYGQAFLPDICELASNMLTYSKEYFLELIKNKHIEVVKPSKYWYHERKDFSPKAIGIDMPKEINQGFTLLQGDGEFEGIILGGCLESIYGMIDDREDNEKFTICNKYKLFPSLDEWQDKILLLETSESKTKPEDFRKMIIKLRDYGLFKVIKGLLFAKPVDEIFVKEYHEILLKEIHNDKLNILANINIGHATPRCIIPLGLKASISFKKQEIRFQK